MKTTLGKLEFVDLRQLWRDEAREFTPWLSTEGLELLGDTIGAELTLMTAEANVGTFSADILARVEGEDEHLVVIENQLERTDHDHLGKTITYASGLGARTVIWIARDFTDEHRQALEWLNSNTEANISFFGLEIQLLKIGDSALAPQFKIISSPNNWAKSIKGSGAVELTETKISQQGFWQELIDFMRSKMTFLSLQKAQPQHWFSISLGRSNFIISLTLNSQKSRAGCALYASNDPSKRAFELLLDQRNEIEKELGISLDWQRLEGKKAFRIATYMDGSIDVKDQREAIKNWMHLSAEQFHKVFSRRIAALDLEADEMEVQ